MNKVIKKIFERNTNLFIFLSFISIIIFSIFMTFFQIVFSQDLHQFTGTVLTDKNKAKLGTFYCYKNPVDRDCQTSCGPGIARTCTVDGRLTPIACGYYKEGKIITYCEIADEVFKVVQAASFQNFVCSFADKLYANTDSNNPGGGVRKVGYLAWGSYNTSNNICYSGNFYKVCCNADGTVAPSVEYPLQDGLWPPEGWCGGKNWARTDYTAPKVGEQHPACKAGAISCTASSTSSGILQVTANTTANSGRIEIKVGSQTKSCDVPPQSCSQTFNVSAGSVTAQASLIQNGQTVASTTCNATVSGSPTPPIYDPPQITAGVCALEGRIFSVKKNNSWLDPGDNQLKKSDLSNTFKVDFGVVDVGEQATYECRFYKKIEQRRQQNCCVKPDGSTYCADFCPSPDQAAGDTTLCGGGDACWVTESKCENEINNNAEWQYATGYNNAKCELESGGSITISAKLLGVLKPNYKWINSSENPYLDLYYNYKTFRINKIEDIGKSWMGLYSDENGLPQITPPYHGDYSFRIDISATRLKNKPSGIDIPGDTGCSTQCKIGNEWKSKKDADNYVYNWDKDQNPILRDSLYNSLFIVTSTNLTSFINISKPTYNHPTDIKTKIRDYIVVSPPKSISITYGVIPDSPFIWRKDEGNSYLTGSLLNSFRIIDNFFQTTIDFILDRAGTFDFCTYHDADDERGKPPDVEPKVCQSITVYRYLCYQGFCWECSQEPITRGGGLLYLPPSSCKVVEPAKCQAYIGSDCKAKGRE